MRKGVTAAPPGRKEIIKFGGRDRTWSRVDPLQAFYPAEAYRQDYLVLHPNQPYIAINDVPKVEALKTLFPNFWRETPATVRALAAR